ncbi:MAG: hypothetical protein R6X34_06125 [Chloroflexota bacterium]
MKNRETWQNEHDELMQVLEAAREALSQYPGVVSVEIGIKETGSKLTDDLAFRVYVTQKVPPDQLAPNQMIPNEIMGFKTDIIEYDIPVQTENSDKFRPLKGGIQIDNEKPAGYGTLGCIAQVNGSNEVVVLTNAHVVRSGGATGSINMGQPEYVDCCCCTCDDIGHSAASDQLLDGSSDAAIVHLKSGVGAENVIRMLNGDGSDGTVNGSTTAVVSTDTVIKVGRTSDKTQGTILSITHGTPANADEGRPARTNQILIQPNAGVTLFQDRGDSGSVLVDASNRVVGIMWGAYLVPGSSLYGHGIASPIGPVLSGLNISIPTGGLTTSSAAAGVFMETAVSSSQFRQPQPEATQLLAHLQARLSQTTQGRSLLALIETHRREVITLINQKRPVTVTWHRKQGPAYLAALGRSLKEPSYRIPLEINDVSRQQAFLSITAILAEHGSDSLRHTIDQYASQLLTIASNCHTIAEILTVLEEQILSQNPTVAVAA